MSEAPVRAWLVLALALVLPACEHTSFFPAAGEDSCQPTETSGSYRRDPATGRCVPFASPCDVPAEWVACMPYVACVSDGDCTSLEHCATTAMPHDPGVPDRACADNAACAETTECSAGQSCTPGPAGSSGGTCTRVGPDAGISQPPSIPTCQATTECGPLQVCPAQYGGCSPGDMSGVSCPSYCEKACVADTDCNDPTTWRCNAADVCATSSNDQMGHPGLTCAGWCVVRAPP